VNTFAVGDHVEKWAGKYRVAGRVIARGVTGLGEGV
jgi:hypothetical protein